MPLYLRHLSPRGDKSVAEREARESERGELGGRAASCGCGICPRCAAGPSPWPATSFGPGRPLDPAQRGSLEPQFGGTVDSLRLHDDRAAARAARALHAAAFTVGNDVVLGEGAPRDGEAGRRLLRHETTHAAQQASAGERTIQTQVDPTVASLTPQEVGGLSDDDLAHDLELVRQHLVGLDPADPAHAGLIENLHVLEGEAQSRAPNVGGAQPHTVSTVPRPAGLPLDGGFELRPIELAPELAAQIPEGRVVTLPPAPPAPTSAPAATPGGSVSETPGLVGSGLAGGTYAGLNVNLTRYGFAAAGDNAIGLVAFPRWLPSRIPSGMSSVLPEHPVLWGHTAVYARVNGRIVVVRSYAPESLIAAARDPGVLTGGSGTPAAIYDDAGMFRVSNARSMEWAVSQEEAVALMNRLPEPGAIEGALYTAVPATANLCNGPNCVDWAVPLLERQLGGTIGPAAQPGVSVTSLSSDGLLPHNANQGQLMRFLAGAERDPASVAAIGEGAEGALPFAASGLSRGLQVIKWGGRVMLVVGVVSVPLEVYLAPPEQRTRTAVGATAGFLGGLALGATAGLICGPGAPVCSVVLGIGLGIAGAFGARAAAEAIYDADHPQPLAAAGPLPDAFGHPGPCPSCHAPATAAAAPFTVGPLLRPSLQSRAMSDEDLRAIEQFLQH